MICCGHDSLHVLGHLILFQRVLWDLWCESELVNQLTLLNQFKIRLLLQCPSKCMNSVSHSFIYKPCTCCSMQKRWGQPNLIPIAWCCQGGGGVVHGGWGVRLSGHLTDCTASDRCWFVMVGADHSCRPFQGHDLLIHSHPFSADEPGAHPSAFPEGLLWLLLPLNLRTGQM